MTCSFPTVLALCLYSHKSNAILRSGECFAILLRYEDFVAREKVGRRGSVDSKV
jgi:hypothetical protein